MAIMTTLVITMLFHIGYSGLPISWPNTSNKDYGGKNVPYNMIDVFPSCYDRGICPMFAPGTELASFPNSEEKVQHIMHNLFRMFANVSLELKWGKWYLAVTKGGGRTYYCRAACDYCGTTHPDRKPLYWYSDANQAARFKQYDENSCDQSWYEEPGITAHHTCNWVLDEYGGGSHCDLFGNDCDFGSRGSAFCEEDRCWFETEGICGANTCYVDPHCEPIFANKYDYQGTGFVEGMNGASAVYSRYTKEIYYILPSGAHFDERIKIVEEDRNVDGKYLTLMLQYFDVNQTQTPEKCWALYDDGAHEMEVAASDNGDLNRGFSINSYSVMFTSNHLPPTECEPYAFICVTSKNNIFRLPEESSYYFGTEWIDWKWSDYEGDYGLSCKENHYYYNENEKLWLANSGYQGPDGKVLNRVDIWYYTDTTNYGTCIGCSKIAKLECYENCIRSDFQDCANCDDIVGQVEPPKLVSSEGGNTGAIVGIVIVILMFIGCIAGWIYYRRQTDQSLCPSKEDISGCECDCDCPSFTRLDSEDPGDDWHGQTRQTGETDVAYVQ